jgi:hypothetical protein
MDTEWLLSLLPILGLTINVMTQICSAHVLRRIGLSIVIGLTAGFIVDIILLGNLYHNLKDISLIDACINLLTYLTLSFCYWASVNLNITSLRIRLMRELLKQKKGLSTENLLQRYSPEELINRRIQRLVTAKQLKQHEGKWILISQHLLLLAYLLAFLRRLIITPD